jgi:hypothetical protein
MQKKSLKKRVNFPSIACRFLKRLFDICQAQKKGVQAHSRPITGNWFIGQNWIAFFKESSLRNPVTIRDMDD